MVNAGTHGSREMGPAISRYSRLDLEFVNVGSKIELLRLALRHNRQHTAQAPLLTIDDDSNTQLTHLHPSNFLHFFSLFSARASTIRIYCIPFDSPNWSPPSILPFTYNGTFNFRLSGGWQQPTKQPTARCWLGMVRSSIFTAPLPHRPPHATALPLGAHLTPAARNSVNQKLTLRFTGRVGLTGRRRPSAEPPTPSPLPLPPSRTPRTSLLLLPLPHNPRATSRHTVMAP